MSVETSKTGWKGIVLAGGAGSRLHPVTLAASKQMLPVYDKPMIYYPIATLMLGGIRDILIISTPTDLPRFKELLGDGARIGCQFEYVAQEAPRGLPEAFILGADFIGSDGVTLILGDNLFYGDMQFFRNALARHKGGTVFGYPVQDPERYGVVEFDETGKVLSIEEKPTAPKSRYAIPGLYCFDNRVIDVAKNLRPSDRGELEIVDVIQRYLDWEELRVEKMARGIAWLDTGTPQSLLEAANFVATIEHRQGFKIACLEEIALRKGMINRKQFIHLSEELSKSAYGGYLEMVLRDLDG
ncbi:MAG: glucose-1-phosphate thymidylyltransferase RfbA [Kiritimatiellae bacterium]|nr:glucose-1-phosphate thymidylyltransferase RfbA [Kiritimatiellia bacterium]